MQTAPHNKFRISFRDNQVFWGAESFDGKY